MDWSFFAFQIPLWISSLIVVFQNIVKVSNFLFQISPGSYFYSWDNVSECFRVLEKSTPWPVAKMVNNEGLSLFSRTVSSFFWYKGSFVKITPLVSKGDAVSYSSQLNCFGLNAQKNLKDLSFLLQGGLEEDRSSHQIQLLSSEGHAYRYDYVLNPGKHANPIIWKELGDLFDTWLTQKELYRKLDMTWATCILLYGPPGTGKTTLVKQIAAKFDLAIQYNTDFPAKPPEGLVNRSKPFIRVIEDADRRLTWMQSEQLLSLLGLSLDSKEESAPPVSGNPGESKSAAPEDDKASKDKKAREGLGIWLNTMDGPLTLEGQVIILTVNDIEKIPHVIRDRCHEFEVAKINIVQILEMTKSRFGLENLPQPLEVILNTFLEKGHSLRTFKRALLHSEDLATFTLKIESHLLEEVAPAPDLSDLLTPPE